MGSNFAVYRDKGYTTSWISHENAGEIADYLETKEFDVLGARGLKNWMEDVIREGITDTVVVFAQDVAPDTVFERNAFSQDDDLQDKVPDTVFDNIGANTLIRQYLDRDGRAVWMGDLPLSHQGKSGADDDLQGTVFDNIGATTLIRQYLDRGGRVVWIGDMPFSYQGKSGVREAEELKKVDRNAYRTDLKGSSINVLAVIPIFLCAPRNPVKITEEGRKRGIKTVWSSLRPIAIDVTRNEIVKPLAKTKALIAKAQIKYDKRGIGISNLMRFCSERLKSIEIGKGGIGLELSERSKKNEEPRLRYFEEYASAWFKNFNKEEPNSGFVRIWDFSPNIITKGMKEELYDVATYRFKFRQQFPFYLQFRPPTVRGYIIACC
jgi:hypothetical protein